MFKYDIRKKEFYNFIDIINGSVKIQVTYKTTIISKYDYKTKINLQEHVDNILDNHAKLFQSVTFNIIL